MTGHKYNSCQGAISLLAEARAALRIYTEGKTVGPTITLKREESVGGLPLRVSLLLMHTAAWDAASAEKLAKQKNEREPMKMCLSHLKGRQKGDSRRKDNLFNKLCREKQSINILPKDRES